MKENVTAVLADLESTIAKDEEAFLTTVEAAARSVFADTIVVLEHPEDKEERKRYVYAEALMHATKSLKRIAVEQDRLQADGVGFLTLVDVANACSSRYAADRDAAKTIASTMGRHNLK